MTEPARPELSAGREETGSDRADRLLAFLVDGDNATAGLIREMLEEASRYGTLIIRRVYGDWTSPSLQSWRKVLQEHALDPEQQFSNVAGKNATDSALIIDAMDILHRGVVRGFCIVSSDSDYTRLAKRIREEGFFVMGIGRAATPAAFRNACHVFVATENLSGAPETVEAPPARRPRSRRERSAATPTASRASPVSAAAGSPKRPPADALPLLLKAFENSVEENGRAPLGALGNSLQRLDPSFDARSYGRPRLMNLLEALPDTFVLEKSAEHGPHVLFVRRRASRA